MNTHSKSALAASVAAALGGNPGAADAAVFVVTLQQVHIYSNGGTAGTAGNITSSTATWTYDDMTGLLAQAAGVFNVRFTTAPTSTLYRTSITGLVIGNGGPASASTYVCTEGNFGANVGASICGNYYFGANFLNNSTTTWGPGTAVARALGDDDVANGDPQSIATLDGMNVVNGVGGWPPTMVLTNRTCTGTCATLPAGAFNNGQQWTFSAPIVPPEWTMPWPFTFADQAGVPLSSTITSAPVTIAGLQALAPISVFQGLYSVNGGPFTSALGGISNGSTVRVRHSSAAVPNATVDTVLNVGGVTDTFTSTTMQYAVEDTVSTMMDAPLEIDVLANDNGLAASVDVAIQAGPQHGGAVVTGGPGAPWGIRITYTPDPGYVGPDGFTYRLQSDQVTDEAFVRIYVLDPDPDGDGLLSTVDNCAQVANPTQCDSDGDGYGNHCDADLNNNGVTNAQDTVVFRTQLGRASSAPAYNAADLNCNGAVNAQDTVLFRQLLGKPPGPSGLVP